MLSRFRLKDFVSSTRSLVSMNSLTTSQSNTSVRTNFQCQFNNVGRQPLISTVPSRFFSTEKTEQKNEAAEDVDLEKEKEEKEKKRQRQKKITNYTLVGMGAAFSGALIYAFFEWGKPGVDENGNVIIDQFTEEPFFAQHVKRAWSAMTTYEKALKEPSRELLLPPPLPAPYYQPPYTLVLEMTGVLVHPEWTYSSGWRFKKRPYVDYLLHTCASSSKFEIVIYTKEQGFTAFPLLNSLDPDGYIMYRLFRDSTRYENGAHIKDLNMLNRDLKAVVHIDWDEKACQSNPDNCLKLKKWDGNSDNDRVLYDLANFLMAISSGKLGDVREVLRYYSQFDDPLEAFKENQRKLAEQEKELEAAKLQQSAARKSSLFSSLRLK